MYLDKKLSAAMWGRLLLLLIVLSAIFAILGAAVLYIGRDAQDRIQTELASQQITFPPADGLTEEELAIDGMEENAGKLVETGEQAQIYSEFILLHMEESAAEAGFPGATYATLGPEQRAARADLAAATEAGDEAAIAEAQAEVDSITQLRNTMLTGSNLRGNLLQAYGWDTMVSNIIVAGIGLLIAAAVFLLMLVIEVRRGHLPPLQD